MQEQAIFLAYLLKIEPNTPYGQQQNTLLLPDDDQMGDFYLCMVEELESRGYHHNMKFLIFAQKVSKRNVCNIQQAFNTKYWQGKENTLGIGTV